MDSLLPLNTLFRKELFMAYTHIEISNNTPLGGELNAAIKQFRNGLATIRQHQQAMPAKIDATPDPDDFTHLQEVYGTESPEKAELLFDEVSAMLGQIDGTAAGPAIEQFLNLTL
jgi:hypothetical protein